MKTKKKVAALAKDMLVAELPFDNAYSLDSLQENLSR